MSPTVLIYQNLQSSSLPSLLFSYSLTLEQVKDGAEIPGSYWGDAEAGLIGNTLYTRNDTPIHSILHEACHYICMDEARRSVLNTNAEGDYDEENAVCYLQILLADQLPEMGSKRMMQDMDNWGYTFRLGSALRWFTEDAEDAKQWLMQHNLITSDQRPTFKLRIQ